jgi:hypothetical protein
MESHDETDCQAQAQNGPILCVNNCGFFGSSATMNMCSKCHKDTILKQEQAQLAASSIGSIVNGCGKEPVIAGIMNVDSTPFEPKHVSAAPLQSNLSFGSSSEVKPKEGPKRCNTCRKRVGLTGFDCKCGNHFCATHRYSDKHDCTFDYRAAAQDSIAKVNPVVKAEKLDKI